jgi:hypothetical protein
VPEGNAELGSTARSCTTPAGQRVVIDRNSDVWVVVSDDHDPVRHPLLDVALTEAVGRDVHAHWDGIKPGRWVELVAKIMVESWPRQEGRALGD